VLARPCIVKQHRDGFYTTVHDCQILCARNRNRLFGIGGGRESDSSPQIGVASSRRKYSRISGEVFWRKRAAIFD
jgi:hypothetical protein